MDTSKKLIVGYDLGEDYSQISCFSYKSMEPVPISTGEKDELKRIPTVLCLKADTKQWLYGDEARSCAASDEGILIEHLLNRLISGERSELYGQSFDGITLLEKYFRKTLMLIKQYFPTEPVTRLVVTVREAQPALTEGIYAALSLLGLERDRVSILSHAGAYLYYALNQERSLWMNDAGLFEFSEEGLFYYRIRLNRRMKPIIAGLEKTDYSHMLHYSMLKDKENNVPYLFENITGTALYKQLVTTLYFTGKGFEGGWAEQTIKGLCNGRRAFMGQNLFVSGACYAAKEFAGDRTLGDFILLDDDMLAGSVGLKVYCDTRYQEIGLAEAGENWHEINKSIEVIPEGEPELELILKSMLGRETVREKIHLTKLPQRPNRMTRLEINFTCRDRSTGVITVNDLGFGGFYPETGKVMEFTVEI